MKAKRKYKIDKAKVVTAIITLCLVIFTICITVDFFKYPEQYLITWKYQLKNDLTKGNEEALEYYNKRYVANGKYLFGDKYIIESETIKATVNTENILSGANENA